MNWNYKWTIDEPLQVDPTVEISGIPGLEIKNIYSLLTSVFLSSSFRIPGPQISWRAPRFKILGARLAPRFFCLISIPVKTIVEPLQVDHQIDGLLLMLAGLELLKTAIEKAGYTGKIEIGMDVAASEFCKKGFKYDLDFKNPKSDPKEWVRTSECLVGSKTFHRSFTFCIWREKYCSKRLLCGRGGCSVAGAESEAKQVGMVQAVVRRLNRSVWFGLSSGG